MRERIKTMKKQYSKWLNVLAIASYAAAVFMITEKNYWIGIVFIGLGASLMAVGAKKNS